MYLHALFTLRCAVPTVHTVFFVLRSLVALSLILAMLLFKPAPLYILDEVDAALDLSHTQNIGQMIRSHFKHSQVGIFWCKDTIYVCTWYVVDKNAW